MKKTIQTIVLAALCLNFPASAQQKNPPPSSKQGQVKGKVISLKTREPLEGAAIQNINTALTLFTDKHGEFPLDLPAGRYRLAVFLENYQTEYLEIRMPLKEPLIIELEPKDNNLKEVEIVSTGYQNIPKERATGSFTLVDNKLLNRAVSPDLLSRLKGVTNGLLIDGQSGNPAGISIRGRSTIFSDTTPLIVLDNFPYSGDLSTLNPNDIENVTLLKDAAAASIWGVRAGNGVLVITTKKGKLNQKPSVNFNSNITIGGKPDLFYQQQLSSSEFVDLEQFLFNKGAYNAALRNNYATISPVVVILQKLKLNQLTQEQTNNLLDGYRKIDVRDQQSQYYYRKSLQQQYHMDLSGGGTNQTYYLSAGFDQNLPTAVNLSNSRFTLKASTTHKFLDDKLKFSTDITFSNTKTENTNTRGYVPYLPYEQIADANGNPLATLTGNGLRALYTDTAGNGNLLDWKYRPLDELRNKYNTYTSRLTDYRMELGLSYKILSPLSISANYQFYRSNTDGENTYDQDSFYARNMVNTYTRINSGTGEVARPVPKGDIYTPSYASTHSNFGRIQLNFDQTFMDKHQVSAIAGYEIRAEDYKYNSVTLYGYNPETATNTQIDFLTVFPFYYGYQSSAIGKNTYQEGTTDRYRSYYANASYTYDGRYIVSGSYRKDESNLFGVKANQKGVPLWSAGIAWNLHKESFFDLNWLSMLKLRTTYGYNGNVNRSVSACLTAQPGFYANAYDTNFSNIINPPNDALKWERIENLNFGLDFSSKTNRISGSLEYYVKKGMDLIGSSPIAPQTGVSLFTGNTADTKTKGIDLQVNSKNLDRAFKWSSSFILNYVKDKITDYKTDPGTNSNIISPILSTLTPLKGYPINAVFGFKWAGLDNQGNPVGYVNGEKSTDYTRILNSNDPNELEFFGSAMPTVFGGLRNTFSYKFIELSFNISYKLGYYFRKPSLVNQYLNGGQYKLPDYDRRWQKPGDELTTTVPSMIYPANFNRDNFYSASAVQVLKGDQIRLQDIQLNFNFGKAEFKRLPFSNLNVYLYANNLGLLWKANHDGIDPDFTTGYPTPRSIALGVKASF